MRKLNNLFPAKPPCHLLQQASKRMMRDNRITQTHLPTKVNETKKDPNQQEPKLPHPSLWKFSLHHTIKNLLKIDDR